MIDRAELRTIAEERVKDNQTLLEAGRYDGAIYLVGYVVELALMNNLQKKIVQLESEISQEKGDFTLFALFIREDTLEKWDLVLAAPWIESDRREAFSYIMDKIESALQLEDRRSISGVVLTQPSNPALEDLWQSIETEQLPIELYNRSFFGMDMRRAYIITASNPEIAVGVMAD